MLSIRPAVLQPQSPLKKLYDNFRMFGLVQAVGYVLIGSINAILSRLNARRVAFDDQFGTDTETWVFPHELDISKGAKSDGAGCYGPTNLATLRHMFGSLPFRFEGFELIDVGCGKGRVLLFASHYPFAKISGIELSESLVRIARENISRYKANASKVQRCKHVEVVQVDFREYPIPDGNLFFFLFHPFTGKVFEESIQHIHEAAIRHPHRDIYLAYVNPTLNKKRLDECGYFIPLRDVLVMHPTACWSLWKAATFEASSGPTNFTEAPL
jgi:SAM-dependent methyltransferase